jgi:hypothetical protein
VRNALCLGASGERRSPERLARSLGNAPTSRLPGLERSSYLVRRRRAFFGRGAISNAEASGVEDAADATAGAWSTARSVVAAGTAVRGEGSTRSTGLALSAANASFAVMAGVPRQRVAMNSRVDGSAPTAARTTSNPAATRWETFARRLLGTAARSALRKSGGRRRRAVSMDALQGSGTRDSAGAEGACGSARGSGGGPARRGAEGRDAGTDGGHGEERGVGREIVMVMGREESRSLSVPETRPGTRAERYIELPGSLGSP